MPTSDSLVTVDLSALSVEDMRLGDKFIGTADLSAEQRSDDGGPYTHIELAPGPDMPPYIIAIVGLPQMDFADGIEWFELEAWNDGVPLGLELDCSDRDAACFTVEFRPKNIKWEGWRRFRAPMVGEDFLDAQKQANPDITVDEDFGRAIIPPMRIKYLLVIMRQGLLWQLGLRRLIIKPLK